MTAASNMNGSAGMYWLPGWRANTTPGCLGCRLQSASGDLDVDSPIRRQTTDQFRSSMPALALVGLRDRISAVCALGGYLACRYPRGFHQVGLHRIGAALRQL